MVTGLRLESVLYLVEDGQKGFLVYSRNISGLAQKDETAPYRQSLNTEIQRRSEAAGVETIQTRNRSPRILRDK
ncbi:MAG: hypothetical protein CEE38_20535 [Planctomycetes bacterium B3_Pla]|nr:MAG: hypothetical protein CEE38_20535 [Planctomycetes bacterium B3_Pla]